MQEEKKRSLKKEIKSWIVCIAATLVFTLFLTHFIIVNASVPTGSMENTIMPGDKLIAFRVSYWFKEPQRKDIIIFKFPDDETEWYIKRVIALPGETVLVKDGKVYINGKALDEPYIKEEPLDDYGPYKVPDNGYFVMGDNRNSSSDAREWNTHYVTKKEIIGKAIFKYSPSVKMIK